MGSSWAALAAEEDPQGEEGGTPLAEAGAEGGGRRGREGGRGEKWAREGGVLDSESYGRIRWQPSLIEGLS